MRAPPASGSTSRSAGRLLWLWIHKWLGLVLGAALALIGLTGSVIVFYRELDALLNPGFYQATRNPHQLGPAEAFRIARTAVPEPVDFLYAPDTVWPVWSGLFRRHDALWAITIDPGSGRVLGIRDLDASPVRIIYRLHADLLLAPWRGEQMVGVLGLLLLLMAGSGVWLWWPRRGLLAALVRLRVRPRQLLYLDLHALAGAWSAALLLLVAVTGVGVVFPGLLRPVVALVSRVEPQPAPTVADPGRPVAVDADRAVGLALKAAPGGTALRFVMRPSPAGRDGRAGAWQIGLRWRRASTAELVTGAVWVDPWSGAILAARTAGQETNGDRAMDLLLWIHNGSVMGWPGRIAVFLSGLSLPLLFVSGVLFWWRKRRLRRGAAPPRTA